ncbi:hypothetical protein AAF712_009091 [Marasmius tenuissimus]|uniref:chitin deacetylase n=1 Tax=Marasmius tenuissimus TaxID=585030 RepID=A0ABR2ZTC9_9AGAR
MPRPVSTLFVREEGKHHQQRPVVGSPEWTSRYPKPGSIPPRESVPREWLDVLDDKVALGKIPAVSQTTIDPKGKPAYPKGVDHLSQDIGSTTYLTVSHGSGSIWNGPKGTFGISFDDGPLEPTSKLVNFLKANEETATHFIIGGNIVSHPSEFLEVLGYGGDVAVHTWSHPHMTTLSNEDIVAEIGWTIQIIVDSTGRVPRIWRPPYGDSDVRVRAIAKEVFGLETVMWNRDSEDWKMTTNEKTTEALLRDMDGWLAGPKTPGLIVLEHELTEQTVQAFTEAYPRIKNNGWRTESLLALLSDSVLDRDCALVIDRSEPGPLT